MTMMLMMMVVVFIFIAKTAKPPKSSVASWGDYRRTHKVTARARERMRPCDEEILWGAHIARACRHGVRDCLHICATKKVQRFAPQSRRMRRMSGLFSVSVCAKALGIGSI